MSIAFIKTNSGFSAYVDGKTYVVNTQHENYKELVEALRTSDVDKFISLVDVKKAITNYTNGQCTIENDVIMLNGREIHSSVANKIVEMKKEGFPFEFMLRFLEKLEQNPSAQSKAELYDFIANKGIHITPEGDFLCYKIVRNDYWSKTAGNTVLVKGKVDDSGRIYNGIGEEIECQRGEVDDDRRKQCSFGLHVGGLSYAGPQGYFRQSGDKCVVVLINPKDCVSVPLDHDANKLRVCAYKVVREIDEPLQGACLNNDSTKIDFNDYSDDYYDEYDFYDDEVDDDEEYIGMNIDASNIRPGDEITFSYEGKTRYLDVTDVDDKYVVGTLMNPEEYEGSVRRFLVGGISSVYVVN